MSVVSLRDAQVQKSLEPEARRARQARYAQLVTEVIREPEHALELMEYVLNDLTARITGEGVAWPARSIQIAIDYFRERLRAHRSGGS